MIERGGYFQKISLVEGLGLNAKEWRELSRRAHRKRAWNGAQNYFVSDADYAAWAVRVAERKAAEATKREARTLSYSRRNQRRRERWAMDPAFRAKENARRRPKVDRREKPRDNGWHPEPGTGVVL